MNLKITKEALKSSVITSAIIILLGFAFLYVIFFLLWYWIMPKLCVIIPTLKTYIESLNDSALPEAYNIVLSISSCISLFISTTLAYSVSKQRKKKFLTYSKGLISYSDGIKYHIDEYALSDSICMSAIIIASLILYLTNSTGFFPAAFYMFKNFGIVLGLIATAILTIASMICGIFFSQRRWKVQYFIDEEMI